VTAFGSWPLPAKALAAAVAVAALAALWSSVASLVFLVGTGLLDAQRDVPFAQFWTYLRHYPDHPIVGPWLRIAGAAATALVVALVAAFAIRRMRAGDRPLHGETGYAAEAEIRANGFRDVADSIHLGRNGRRYLTFGGPEHVALYAPTRSGKGVGVVIPNCLLWDGSLVVLDVKKENWAASAGIRAEAGQKVFLFDPLDPEGRTARYNPLSYVRRGTIDAFDDIQRIAQMLYPEATGDQEFWTNSARSAFIGVTAFLAETPELPLTLGEVLRMFTRRDLQGYLTGTIEARRLAGQPYTAACINALNDYLAGSADTVSGVRKSVTTKLVLWFNPRIDAATAESDFDLRRLRYNLHAIYVGVTPDNIDRLRPLLALFFQQVVDVTVKTLPQHDPAARHRVLMVLDEFPLLGAMPTLTSAFAFVAGYGVRMLLVLQSKAQMRATYGADVAATVLDNCGAEVVFGTKDLALTKELSERLGYDTVEALTRSGPRFGGWWKRDRQSQSASAQRRALMLPQEIARLGPREEIVLRAGMRPIRATRIRHYEEGRFTRLLRPAPVVPPIAIDVRYDGGGTLPPEPAQPAAAPAAPAPAPAPAAEVQPHQADALWAAVAGAPVDLSDMGLDDGKAAVAALVAAVPTVQKPAATPETQGEGGRPKPRPRARKIG
jgi:type IV secretion system protein VirD4